MDQKTNWINSFRGLKDLKREGPELLTHPNPHIRELYKWTQQEGEIDQTLLFKLNQKVDPVESLEKLKYNLGLI